MKGSYFPITFHVSGTLTADISSTVAFPFGVQLTGVQVSSSGATDSKVKIGTPSNDTAYMTARDSGASKAIKSYDRADFSGGENVHLSPGSLLQLTVTKGTTAAKDVTAILLFTEG